MLWARLCLNSNPLAIMKQLPIYGAVTRISAKASCKKAFEDWFLL